MMQNPDNQIVTDKVWHELAFGLESLGEETDEIRRRVAEICGFFGIGDWYRKRTSELSGGQKQLLNLASIMVMQPKTWFWTRPTSPAGPIAATDFICHTAAKQRGISVTVLLVEHRLEEVFPIAHKVVLMNRARLLMVDTPRNVGKGLKLADPGHKMLLGLPSGVRIYNRLQAEGECRSPCARAGIFWKSTIKTSIAVTT